MTEKIDEIVRAIRFAHTQFIAQNIGWTALTADERMLVRNSVTSQSITPYQKAYVIGLLSKLNKKQLESTTELEQFISSPQGQLSTSEKATLEWSIQCAGNDVRLLGGRVESQAVKLFNDLTYAQTVQQTVAEGIASRTPPKAIASMLAEATQQWSRDFQRIAAYVTHSAYEHGRVQAMQRKYGLDVKVTYRVQPTACKHCKRLYLDPITNKPLVFDLRDIIANGSNIGRKVADWKSCVGPVHPFCRCSLQFHSKNSLVDNSTTTKLARPKVMVTVGNKTFNV